VLQSDGDEEDEEGVEVKEGEREEGEMGLQRAG
jgi:hypothetical protein